MRLIFTVVILTFVLSWLIYDPFRFSPGSIIETKINPTGENLLRWESVGTDNHLLFLHYNREDVPDWVSRDFGNWKKPLETNWSATLVILTNEVLCVATNIIHLTLGRESQEGLFFSIADRRFLKAERLRITVTPLEKPPFGAVPSLSIRPDSESYITSRVRLFESKVICATVAVVLILGLFWEQRSRGKNGVANHNKDTAEK